MWWVNNYWCDDELIITQGIKKKEKVIKTLKSLKPKESNICLLKQNNIYRKTVRNCLTSVTDLIQDTKGKFNLCDIHHFLKKVSLQIYFNQ